MPPNTTLIAAALAAGLVAGFLLRPLVMPGAPAGPDKPTDAEATAAVRDLKDFRDKKPSLPQSTVKLGDCNPSTMVAGVVCFAEFKATPQDEAKVRTMGFARLGGVWKFTGWLN